jgi:hypothetical protein
MANTDQEAQDGNYVVVQHARDNALDVALVYGERRVAVQDVGIGHPVHTIIDGRARVATDVEVALAKALAIGCAREESIQDEELVKFLMWFMDKDELSADHARRHVADYRAHQLEVERG